MLALATNADIQALIARFGKIGYMIAQLYPTEETGDISAISEVMKLASGRESRLRTLVQSYQVAISQFATVAPDAKVAPDYIDIPSDLPSSGYVEIADRLRICCDMALAFLQSLASRIPANERKQLDLLRRQIAPVETSDRDLFKHVCSAMDEYENAHFLAAALLAGKCIVYALDKVPGKNDNERTEHLVKAGLLNEDLKKRFLRGARDARNYFSHKISASAEPSDALNVISDAVSISSKLATTRFLSPKN